MLKKKPLYIVIVVGILLLAGGSFFYIKMKSNLGRKEFSSFEEFCEAGGVPVYGRTDGTLPEGVKEIHYYLSRTTLYKKSIYSFVIEEEAAYDLFMEEIKDYSCKEYAASNPYWNWDDDNIYTEDELVEMKYLEENYMNMNYKEILSMSRHNKGFANGYGASVKDFLDLSYSLNNFPEGMPFSEVISDNIEDYTVLYYYPQGSGSKSEGILVNEETRCFVIYYFGGAR
ncbi:MAG: hypothetical protein IJA32_12405 [Lachnospiraceae bacterium]|nr:hypothetical protein [Lachnospiraceae bacterium]